MKRVKDKMIEQSAILENSVKIHLLSDSLCCDYPTWNDPSVRPMTGWGELLGNYFTEGVVIYNKARPGWSTKGFLTDDGTETDKKWNTGILPNISEKDYLIISLSINDSSSDTWKVSISEFKANLQRFIDEAEVANVIFVGSTGMVKWQGQPSVPWEHSYGITADYNNAMKELADANGIPYLDVYGEYKKIIEKIGINTVLDKYHFTKRSIERLENEGYEIGSRFVNHADEEQYQEDGVYDGTHYNPDGARYIAELIVKLLNNSESTLRNYLK